MDLQQIQIIFSQPLQFLIITLMITISVISIKLSKSQKPTSISYTNLPPAPWKLPVIGHIHHFLVTAQPPHRLLRELSRKHGDVIRLTLGDTPHVVVSSAEAAKQVMRTHDVKFAQRPMHPHHSKVMWGASNLIHTPYGDYWRQLRRIATLELLTSRRVESFCSIRQAEVARLVREIREHAKDPSLEGFVIDLSKKVFNTTYSIILRAIFGDVWSEQEEFIKVAKEIVEYGGGFGISYLFPSCKLVQRLAGMEDWLNRIHVAIDRLIEGIITHHRNKMKYDQGGHEDLLGVLLDLQQDETALGFKLSNNSIKGFLLDIFLAGSETPSALIEWTMSEMLKHPHVLQKAQSEVRKLFVDKGQVDEANIHQLDYLKLVIKETLRLHTPAPLLLPRECIEECRVGGYDIPLKTTVVVNVWAVARDPRYWGPDAEVFKPDRFIGSSVSYKGGDFEFLPFGAGKRMCPGIGFGLASVELCLANLLFHFDWKLPVGMEPNSLNMDELFGVTIRRKEKLELIPVVYNNS